MWIRSQTGSSGSRAAGAAWACLWLASVSANAAENLQGAATQVLPDISPGRVQYGPDGNPLDPCDQFDAQYDSWLDAGQVGLYSSVCEAAAWFDDFFGDLRYDARTGNTFGRLSVGGFWDERDKFDDRIRLRADFALPALRDDASFFIESGDEDGVVDELGREASGDGQAALGSTDDSSLYTGFGFNKMKNLEQGFSFRVGAKVRAPIETFAKARYSYGFRLTPNNLLRLRPVAYWRDDEGFGATLGVDLDNYLNDAMLLRWDNFGNVTQDEDIEGMRWGSTLTLYQALSAKRALTYSTFVRGETEEKVKLQNYGYEVTFRHRFLRDWLFLQYVASLSYPRENLEDRRTSNWGAGVRFDMFFGPTPPDKMR